MSNEQEISQDQSRIDFETDFGLSAEEREDLDYPANAPARVTYSGQDFDIHGLVRRLDAGDIVVPQFGKRDDEIETAGFQRGFVWNRPQMDRFIESLLLGFPIPGIFLVKQADGRMLVLDGQQRLRTLQYFYSRMYKDRTYRLRYVANDFEDLSYDMLEESQRRQLDNSFIQATIVTVQPDPGNMEAVYQIFERLNSGGTQLTAHEIRVALYAGPIIDYLEELNVSKSWRSLYGSKNQRIRDQELVARIIALYLDWENYSRPLKSFLNSLMAKNRQQVLTETKEAGELFQKAAWMLNDVFGRAAIRRASRQVNNAWTDALFVGLMKRIAESPISAEELTIVYKQLREDEEFQSWIVGPSADEDQVHRRMKHAISAFMQS